jgi:hypothetical protein
MAVSPGAIQRRLRQFKSGRQATADNPYQEPAPTPPPTAAPNANPNPQPATPAAPQFNFDSNAIAQALQQHYATDPFWQSVGARMQQPAPPPAVTPRRDPGNIDPGFRWTGQQQTPGLTARPIPENFDPGFHLTPGGNTGGGQNLWNNKPALQRRLRQGPRGAK